jgi:hypothetical protein
MIRLSYNTINKAKLQYFIIFWIPASCPQRQQADLHGGRGRGNDK